MGLMSKNNSSARADTCDSNRGSWGDIRGKLTLNINWLLKTLWRDVGHLYALSDGLLMSLLRLRLVDIARHFLVRLLVFLFASLKILGK